MFIEQAMAMSSGFAPSIGGVILMGIFFGVIYLGSAIGLIYLVDWLRRKLTEMFTK